MPIKNYTTKVSAAKTVGEIQEILAKHGACRVMLDFGEGGRVLGVTFAIPDVGGFRLPARTESVRRVMNEQGIKCDVVRAGMVAWRNVKDWIDAQMAMVEAGQAEIAEVMLPYMLRDGVTLYEAMAGKLIESGGRDGR